MPSGPFFWGLTKLLCTLLQCLIHPLITFRASILSCSLLQLLVFNFIDLFVHFDSFSFLRLNYLLPTFAFLLSTLSHAHVHLQSSREHLNATRHSYSLSANLPTPHPLLTIELFGSSIRSAIPGYYGLWAYRSYIHAIYVNDYYLFFYPCFRKPLHVKVRLSSSLTIQYPNLLLPYPVLMVFVPKFTHPSSTDEQS